MNNAVRAKNRRHAARGALLPALRGLSQCLPRLPADRGHAYGLYVPGAIGILLTACSRECRGQGSGACLLALRRLQDVCPCASTFRACSWSFASISTGERSPLGRGMLFRLARRAMALARPLRRGRPARGMAQRNFRRDGKLADACPLSSQVGRGRAICRLRWAARTFSERGGDRADMTHTRHGVPRQHQEGEMSKTAGPLAKTQSRAANQARRRARPSRWSSGDGRAMAAGAERLPRGVRAHRGSLPPGGAMDEVPGAIKTHCPRRARRRVLLFRGNPGALGLDLAEKPRPEGYSVTVAPDGDPDVPARSFNRDAGPAAEIGVNGVDWALAETGKRLSSSRAGDRPRSDLALARPTWLSFDRGCPLLSAGGRWAPAGSAHADSGAEPMSGAVIKTSIRGPSRTPTRQPDPMNPRRWADPSPPSVFLNGAR